MDTSVRIDKEDAYLLYNALGTLIPQLSKELLHLPTHTASDRVLSNGTRDLIQRYRTIRSNLAQQLATKQINSHG